MGARADALKETVEAAWRVFDIPAPATTGVCQRCCMDPKIEADFLKRRARDLPAHYVNDWYNGAYDSGIAHDHVAWFLPRVMEMLAAGEEVATVGEEVALSRLPLAGFPEDWSLGEISSVTQFATDFFAAFLLGEIPQDYLDIDSALCMFAKGGLPMQPLLSQLDALADEVLIDLLHQEWIFETTRHISHTPFWDHGPAFVQVHAWFRSDALKARLWKAVENGNERAADLLEAIQNSPA
jgi:hypothetical protein